jgi:hypothetical protein
LEIPGILVVLLMEFLVSMMFGCFSGIGEGSRENYFVRFDWKSYFRLMGVALTCRKVSLMDGMQ